MSMIIGGGGDCPPEYVLSKCSKPRPKVVYLPTAGFDKFEGDELSEYLAKGCEASVLFLMDDTLTDEEIRSRIMSADIIHARGGNLRNLMVYWKKRGVDKLIRERFNQGDVILCGSSSGSMCWFERGYDDCGENNEFMFIDCVGLLPFCNCPHYDSEYWKRFDSAVSSQELPGLACDNDAALVYDNGEFYTAFFEEADESTGVYLLDNRCDFQKIRLNENTDILKEFM
ncbi:MAG: Type 1 glutamine amidotransferase-like domain-containing protein [Clostridia bacterium]|nr:Type 1 glutamine amidotransferase-like domain-containing protein [Clostridia bacterium]